ncbi:MAG: hypothetical protein KJ058_15220, partial [Thermoanaerobaculia bacterium]|nr:hypothetical protein [Thermoanaerobaculia bacterium]
MSPVLLGWIAVALYFAVTAGLALRGARGSGSLAGYAIGGGGRPAPRGGRGGAGPRAGGGGPGRKPP